MTCMADRIRRARRVAGFSQEQLASMVGVQRSAVAQWEREGGTCPSVHHLAQVAVAMQVRFEWLATGRGEASHGADELQHALMSADFARDELEAKVLELLRAMSPKRRSTAYRMLRTLA
jgi:transcriptional regulator with XRE-family HTH domain